MLAPRRSLRCHSRRSRSAAHSQHLNQRKHRRRRYNKRQLVHRRTHESARCRFTTHLFRSTTWLWSFCLAARCSCSRSFAHPLYAYASTRSSSPTRAHHLPTSTPPRSTHWSLFLSPLRNRSFRLRPRCRISLHLSPSRARRRRIMDVGAYDAYNNHRSTLQGAQNDG